MTEKTYIMREMEGRGFNRFNEIPEEMLDYLPENLDKDDDSEWDADNHNFN